MDVSGKLLDVGDRVLILSPFLYGDTELDPKLKCTGVIFGIAAENAYVVYYDGPQQEGWEGWGSDTSVLVLGRHLLKYDYEWSYT